MQIKEEINESNSKQERPKVLSWVIDTLNPINHLPVISTIKKLSSKTNNTLDIVQSALGGAIYGGGPIGLAKGIGGWFIDKILPQNFFASNKQGTPKSNNLKDVDHQKSIKIIEKKVNTKTMPISLLPEINTKTKTEETNNKINKNTDFINFYINKEKPVKKKIDINA